jgi:uncharacterized protein YegP (UPF0339 family)
LTSLLGTVTALRRRRRRSILADSGRKFMLFWDIRSGETRYRWRLREATSETVDCSADGYTDKAECMADIALMKHKYPGAPVEDLTIASSSENL